MSGDQEDDVIFTVSMLAEMRPAFVAWLGENNLHMGQLPYMAEYVVVPTPTPGEESAESLWYELLGSKITLSDYMARGGRELD